MNCVSTEEGERECVCVCACVWSVCVCGECMYVCEEGAHGHIVNTGMKEQRTE